MQNWSRWAFAVFLLLAVIIRWGTFFPSVINHDETTYLLIGKGLLNGQTYLVDSFDTKPIGIFLIYALWNALSSGAIWLMRLFTALTVGLTAYLLYRLAKKATAEERIGWTAGISYLLLTSIFKYYGLSPNTELFFTPLVAGAVLLAWSDSRSIPRYMLVGLLLGMAFMIKYVVAADALAIGLCLLGLGWRKGTLNTTIFRQCLPMTLVFCLPLMCAYFYYSSIGQTDAFLFYTFEVTGKYPVEASWWTRLLFSLEFYGRFFPFTLLAVFAYRERLSEDRDWQNFLLLWLLCTTVMTLIPGKTFGHYQIQIMLPLALLTATWFHPERRQQQWLRNWSPKFAWGLLAALLLGLSIGLWRYYTKKTDYPKAITEILQSRMEEGDQVYTGNYHHIVYHLLDQAPLTPYVHSSLLFYEHHVDALGIDLAAEAHKIIDGHQPRYVLLREDYPKN
ncbi:MAG: glycosyltransferase family 39 protein, partial [Bacteroidota bacterium]